MIPDRTRGLYESHAPSALAADGEAPIPIGAALAVAAASGEVWAVADAAALAARVRRECLPAARELVHLAGRGGLLCLAATRPDGDTDPGPLADARAIAAAGGGRLDLLTRLAGDRSASANTDPCGAFARTRAAVARGLATGAVGCAEEGARSAAVTQLREIADARFRQVAEAEGAAGMFVGGKNATPDKHGFRKTRPDSIVGWLQKRLARVSDRHGLPVSHPSRAGSEELDKQLRNWPLPALGDQPLLAFADLQAAEHLARALEPKPERTPAPDRFDARAYRRFVHAGALAPVFRAAPDYELVRVDLGAVPLAVFAARAAQPAFPTGGAPGLRPTERCGLTGPHLPLALRLLGTGAGHQATAEVLNWRARSNHTAARVRELDDQARVAVTGFAGHLKDPWLLTVAKSVRRSPTDLARLVGSDDPADGSFLRRFASGLARALGEPDGWQDDLPAKLERFRNATGSPEALDPHTAARWWRPRIDATQYTLLGSPVRAVRETAAWYAVAERDLEDAVGAAAFAVIEAGHRLVARTDDELLAEVTAGSDPGAVARAAECGLATVLRTVPVKVRGEVVECW